MRNYLFAVLIIGSFVIVGCKSGQEAVQESHSTAVITNDSITIQSAQDSLFASISRTACFGSCPIYTIDIYQSGYTVYNGIRFVQKQGVYTTTISEARIEQLIDTAKAIGYMQMKDEYDGPISDLPSTITSIVINENRKTVRRRYDYPKSILRFEQLFDDILLTENWTLIEASNDH